LWSLPLQLNEKWVLGGVEVSDYKCITMWVCLGECCYNVRFVTKRQRGLMGLVICCNVRFVTKRQQELMGLVVCACMLTSMCVS